MDLFPPVLALFAQTACASCAGLLFVLYRTRGTRSFLICAFLFTSGSFLALVDLFALLVDGFPLLGSLNEEGGIGGTASIARSFASTAAGLSILILLPELRMEIDGTPPCFRNHLPTFIGAALFLTVTAGASVYFRMRTAQEIYILIALAGAGGSLRKASLKTPRAVPKRILLKYGNAVISLSALGVVASALGNWSDASPMSTVVNSILLAAGSVVGIVLLARIYFHCPSISIVPEYIVRLCGISPREREIIAMAVEGYTNHQIGLRLFISEKTVKNHVYHIYRKLGIGSRTELLGYVILPDGGTA